MKPIILLLLVISFSSSFAQNVGIGTKDPQNKLHIAGGLRIDTLANKIDSGLLLHNKQGVVSSLRFTGRRSDVLRGDGTFAAAAATGSWLLTGNGGTGTANFLGTTDNQPLRFRVNNTPFGSLGGNIVLGNSALPSDSSADNVAIGNGALHNMKNSYANTAIGINAMYNLKGPGPSRLDVGENVAYGAYAMYSSVNGDNHTAIGYEALYSETGGSNLTAVGHQSLYANLGGIRNTGLGFQTLRYNTTGSQNTAVGYAALYNNITGVMNTVVGVEAVYHNTTASGLTAIGWRALSYNENGLSNTATGSSALEFNTSGSYNVADGFQSLLNNSTGSYNSGFGFKALYTNSAGANNTATGFKALNFNTTGGNNTATGWQALNTNTTGNFNTAIGVGADVTSGNFTNATAIGYNAKVNASNTVRLGNASVTKIEGQVPFTTPSDGRFKFNIRKDVGGLDFIMKLNPVTYQFDVKRFDHLTTVADADYDNAAALRRTGFIAQEVEKAALETGFDFSGISRPASAEGHYSLSYESFVVPLVKGMQEQQQMIIKLQTIIAQQQKQIDRLIKSQTTGGITGAAL